MLAFCLNFMLPGCRNSEKGSSDNVNILFLHHSVGFCVWSGEQNFLGRHLKLFRKSAVKNEFNEYNKKNGTGYNINEQIFPKAKPYGWNNYPFDYYNIWVKHADTPFMEEPTLEILTKKYQVIVLKHCFPVSDILEDTGKPDINSPDKRIENYTLQYLALRDKMHQFPQVKFIVWTGSALVKALTSEDKALRARKFSDWVKDVWDQPNDNIYLWDFRDLETEGGLYLKNSYALNGNNPHPNEAFSEKVSKLFVQRVIDVIESSGTKTNIKGQYLLTK
jgi:hypothetical protein